MMWIKYYSPKLNQTIKIRNQTETNYAKLLDEDDDVILWMYQVTKMKYIDGFTGKWKTYICDFRVERKNFIENIEIKPPNKQLPLTKYLYAKNCIENWRWITEEELNQCTK